MPYAVRLPATVSTSQWLGFRPRSVDDLRARHEFGRHFDIASEISAPPNL